MITTATIIISMNNNIYNLIITEVVISENEEYVYMVTMNNSNINVASE